MVNENPPNPQQNAQVNPQQNVQLNDQQNLHPNHTTHSFSDIRALIPDSFSGEKREFYEFLQNCENAYRLCQGGQKELILVYIVSKLKGSARTVIQEKEFTSWDDLKKVLTQAFSDNRDLTQLMEELNNIRQKKFESVQTFCTRLEQIQTRVLNSISLKYSGNADLTGRLASVRDTALQRFILHSSEEISMALRRIKPKSLTDAISEALLEEKHLQARQNFTNIEKTCNFCHKPGHFSKHCRKKQKPFLDNNVNPNQKFNQRSSQASSSGNNNNRESNNFQGKFCNYCKKNGHLIQECRKREYNNRNKNRQQNATSGTSSQEVHLNYQGSKVLAVPVDQI